MLDQQTFYYASDKKVFRNKLEAIQYRRNYKKDLFYFYHDNVYSKIDWTIEPPGSLNSYYKMQAQRLRDEYDYIVLFYSGGYDSTNILETFYYNNIRLDKIVCVGAFNQDSRTGVDENHNGELYHNAFPCITQLGLEKISEIHDYTDHFESIKNFSVYQYGEQWIENVGPWFSPHNWFWKDIHKHVVPSSMQDKKVALVWGKDKANLSMKNGKYGFTFKDIESLSYGGEVSHPNIDRINFYWDPKNPLVVVKQVHELLKIPGNDPNKLYNLKTQLRFKSPKSPSRVLSLRDAFLRNKTNNDMFDFYNMGVRNLSGRIQSKTDLEAIRSRFYAITN